MLDTSYYHVYLILGLHALILNAVGFVSSKADCGLGLLLSVRLFLKPLDPVREYCKLAWRSFLDPDRSLG